MFNKASAQPTNIQGAQLPPTPAQIGIFPNFIARQSETLVLKEKVLSISGDDFSIKTLDGRPIFKVHGEVFSMSGRKKVVDMQGNHLFTIRKQHFSIPATYYAEDPQGTKFFEVAGKWSCQYCHVFVSPAILIVL